MNVLTFLFVDLLIALVLAKRFAKPTTEKEGKPETDTKAKFRKLLLVWRKRETDSYGSGSYGASRDEGKRKHEGQDYVSIPGDPIFAPFDGEYERMAYPYGDDKRYTGMVFLQYPYRITVFYVSPKVPTGKVKAGDIVGFAQDLSPKYKGITNHIHVEIENRLGFGKSDPNLFF